MDTGRRGKRDRHKVEAGAANTRQDGLLGDTREELFIVNLHINDSFLPVKISLLHAENTMCRELVRMAANAAFVSRHMYVQYVCVCSRVFVCL